jgi:class 3 adenylate cyclase
MGIDYDSLTLSDIMRLQDELSQVLKRRFEKPLALAFSDIVGSTPYFERFGNEAGESMRRRHNDLVQQILQPHEARLVDTAGDGAFTCFAHVESAVEAYTQFQNLISESNAARAREHMLTVRVGIHYGPVLTDGTIVSGDPVNVCSRVAGTASGGQVRITKDAFLQLPPSMRMLCRRAPAAELKGISRQVDMFFVEWRDPINFPTAVLIEEVNRTVPLPAQDLITFGRLRELDGGSANDIVLSLPDPQATQQISRWHFEIRRHREGLLLRSVTEAATEVDGTPLSKGQERPVLAGTVVRLAGGRMTLHFVGDGRDMNAGSTLGTPNL